IASLKRINTLPLYSHIADIVSPTPWTLDIHLTQPVMKVSDHLTWLAEAMIDAVVQQAWVQMVARYGK
ncbi:hypothetical protein, partial [Escherichia coli]|uniref:hypothetical protein n=1 Tax=Escherichia coli TaxID=562 RepID=UPI003EE2AADE